MQNIFIKTKNWAWLYIYIKMHSNNYKLKNTNLKIPITHYSVLSDQAISPPFF